METLAYIYNALAYEASENNESETVTGIPVAQEVTPTQQSIVKGNTKTNSVNHRLSTAWSAVRRSALAIL